jgi:hypothetical protein
MPVVSKKRGQTQNRLFAEGQLDTLPDKVHDAPRALVNTLFGRPIISRTLPPMLQFSKGLLVAKNLLMTFASVEWRAEQNRIAATCEKHAQSTIN